MESMEAFFEAMKRKREQAEEPASGEPYLIAGLGNPGRQYHESRHNFGFMVVDKVAEILKAEFKKGQFKALVSLQPYAGKKVILAKPQAFMNLSGQPVISLMNYYKVSRSNLLVIHDDLDLPFNTIRMRPGGGSGGQKGLASIIELSGTQEFARLRCGIGHPPGQMEVPDYVLSKFSKAEAEILPSIIANAAEAALSFVANGIQDTMTRFNGTVEG